MRNSVLKVLSLTLFWVFSAPLVTVSTAAADAITKFPAKIMRDCNFGRAKLYDQCGSQVTLFQNALRAANAEGKVLLVSYGAEWCIWCHVFDEYISGAHTKLTYRYGDSSEKTTFAVTLFERPKDDPSARAGELSTFVARNFVVAHIEGQFADDGWDVINQADAAPHTNGGIPFIFSVNSDGAFAAALDPKAVETRRDTEDWYRGYDRQNLMRSLKEMHQAAMK